MGPKFVLALELFEVGRVSLDESSVVPTSNICLLEVILSLIGALHVKCDM